MVSKGFYRYDSDFFKRHVFLQLFKNVFFHVDVYIYTSSGSVYWSIICACTVYSCECQQQRDKTVLATLTEISSQKINESKGHLQISVFEYSCSHENRQG